MRERDVKAYFLKRVKDLGGEARKMRWEGRTAAPDWLVLFPRPIFQGGPWLFFVELKRPKKGAEALQAEEHDILRRFGATVFVLDSPEAIDEVLK